MPIHMRVPHVRKISRLMFAPMNHQKLVPLLRQPRGDGPADELSPAQNRDPHDPVLREHAGLLKTRLR
jgi:hypothetical protein